MKLRTRRAGTRAGSAALAFAAAGLLGAPAGMAQAADRSGADLALRVSAGTVAIGGPLAAHRVTVLNHGPDGARAWHLAYDLRGLDDRVVTLDRIAPGCTRTGTTVTCDAADLAPAHRLAWPTPFALRRMPGRHGTAGTIVVTAVSEGDPDQTNNSVTYEVEVPPLGVDLVVHAEDIYRVTDAGEPTDQPVPPGSVSTLFGAVANAGDTVAAGVTVSVTLPRYVTFAEAEPDCAYSADKRTASCDYPQITLVPMDWDRGADDAFYSVIGVYFPVRVAADAPGPVVVRGGVFTSHALGVEGEADVRVLARRGAATLPENVTALSARKVADVNPSDNSYPFAAHIAPPAADGSDGGDGGGGGLPITGGPAGRIGGVGVGVLALGGVLLLLARRRV